jgi:anaerobic selenocysteine-containing dehydrogenase
MADRTVFRTCPLCEATCGLEISMAGDEVVRIRGDRDDVFSAGFICPKGSTLKQLEADPDVLRRPQVRRDGTWSEVSWDDAFAVVAGGLAPIVEEYGPQSVAVYLGNPNVHNMSGALYGRVFLKALGTRNVFSASTVDQMPKHVSAGLMFGHPDSIPVPDLDRTAYLLMLGANPYASNGSLATAPNFPGRLEGIRSRGGKVVVVDPRRTRTAEAADEHLAVRPGTDALLLFAMVHTLFDEGLVAPGRLAPHLAGVDEVAAAALGFAPERVAASTGIDAATIRRIARELAAAPSAAVYGRIGTHTVRFGTLASWLVDVLNALTGNLDGAGGAMFAMAAHERPRARTGWSTGRWRSRVRGLPEVRGELPVATLVDEIETPGEGKVRALVTIAGNPVLSTPNGARLDAALASLDFMLSIDLYRNETTRRADVILPPPTPMRRSHYDFAFYQLSVRNVANYSPVLVAREPGALDEWEILLRLAAILSGMGPDADVGPLDDMVAATLAGRAATTSGADTDPGDLLAAVGAERGPERLLDLLLRTGPYGVTLQQLREHPHGIDLGPLQPRLPDLLATSSGRVELAPPPIMEDVAALEATLDAAGNGGFVLVGRRHLRSNNSWMHNLEVLVKGKERCTLQVHPDDAAAAGVADGGTAVVRSRVGEVRATVEVTDAVRPGVVSLPHGWGHDLEGIALGVASEKPGVNTNLLTDEAEIDPLSGNAVLNGIPVTVGPA